MKFKTDDLVVVGGNLGYISSEENCNILEVTYYSPVFELWYDRKVNVNYIKRATEYDILKYIDHGLDNVLWAKGICG